MAEDEAEEDAGAVIDVAAAGKSAAGKAADAADIIDVAAASKPAAEEVTSRTSPQITGARLSLAKCQGRMHKMKAAMAQ